VTSERRGERNAGVQRRRRHFKPVTREELRRAISFHGDLKTEVFREGESVKGVADSGETLNDL
jgi:hypothetical protein